jgi:hypothetical protein
MDHGHRDFRALFAKGRAPTLRVVLVISEP